MVFIGLRFKLPQKCLFQIASYNLLHVFQLTRYILFQGHLCCFHICCNVTVYFDDLYRSVVCVHYNRWQLFAERTVTITPPPGCAVIDRNIALHRNKIVKEVNILHTRVAIKTKGNKQNCQVNPYSIVKYTSHRTVHSVTFTMQRTPHRQIKNSALLCSGFYVDGKRRHL